MEACEELLPPPRVLVVPPQLCVSETTQCQQSYLSDTTPCQQSASVLMDVFCVRKCASIDVHEHARGCCRRRGSLSSRRSCVLMDVVARQQLSVYFVTQAPYLALMDVVACQQLYVHLVTRALY